MPLKLIEPHEGRTPNYTIRGTYLKVYVDRSTGTPNKAVAQKILLQVRQQIERGELSQQADIGPTFLSAALAYIKAGGESRFVGVYNEDTKKWNGLIAHFGETPLAEVDQQMVDEAAMAILPNATNATRNRQVYTPLSAIMKRAGIKQTFKRPKGARGNRRLSWLQPEQAFALFKAASERDPEFGLFLRTLVYTGMRLSEALKAKVDLLDLSKGYLFLPTTKPGEPRGVHLPPHLVAALANHPRGLNRPGQKLFRFSKCGRLYAWLSTDLEKAELKLADGDAFHVFRHTWGTWMRQYAGLDLHGLVATGAWADLQSAAVYAHVVVSEEARRADMLPVENQKLPRQRRSKRAA